MLNFRAARVFVPRRGRLGRSLRRRVRLAFERAAHRRVDPRRRQRRVGGGLQRHQQDERGQRRRLRVRRGLRQRVLRRRRLLQQRLYRDVASPATPPGAPGICAFVPAGGLAARRRGLPGLGPVHLRPRRDVRRRRRLPQLRPRNDLRAGPCHGAAVSGGRVCDGHGTCTARAPTVICAPFNCDPTPPAPAPPPAPRTAIASARSA